MLLAGAQFVVDGDVAALVRGDARLVEAEIAGVRDAADGEQHMRANHRAIAVVAVDADRNAFFVRGKRDAFGLHTEGDAFFFQDRLDGLGNVRIFPGDEVRTLLDDRHLGSEAAVHLGEFQPDIAAADDDQMLGQEVDVHHGRVGEVAHSVDARHGRHVGAAADIDEDALGAESVSPLTATSCGETKAAWPRKTVQRSMPSSQSSCRRGNPASPCPCAP